MVRFVLDAICFKWSDMGPGDMDRNRRIAAHGLDRRHYFRMEGAVCMAVRFAKWITALDSGRDDADAPFPGFLACIPGFPE